MYVKRGNYTHANNEARFSVRKEAQYADNQTLIGTKWQVGIRGMKTGADVAALSASMIAMEAAYSVTTGNFQVLQNDGSTEVPLYKIDGSKTIGGIRMMRFNYALSDPAELTTYVNYEIDLEADFGGVGIIGGGNVGQSTILTWSESLSIRGTGGPRFVVREARNGTPQKQIVSQRTPVFATQRGEAVGLFTWPSPSQPIWPQHLSAPDVDVQRTSASSVGGQGNQQQRREYRVSWVYQYQSIGQLTASPATGF